MEEFVQMVDEATGATEGVDTGRKVLGVVAMAGVRDGTPIFTHTSGKTALPLSAPLITKDSILTLASCTKLITSIAALQLVQSGLFILDDPTLISTHLPELCAQSVFTSATDPTEFSVMPREPDKPITLRHLLTHTSGSSADFLDPKLIAWRKTRGEDPESYFSAPYPDALISPLKFQPGQGWQYGAGLDWTGLLIARVTGRELGEYLRSEVFDRVGCDARIGFHRTRLDEEWGIVEIVMMGPEGRLVPHPWPVAACELEDRGGGGMYASAENFFKILADLVSPAPKLLSLQTLDLLFSPQFPAQGGGSEGETEESLPLAGLHAAIPFFGSMMTGLITNVPASAVNYGLGGVLITADQGADGGLGKTKGTLSWGGAFNCLWFANRESGVAAFYGSSMFPPGEEGSRGLMEGFVRRVVGRDWDARGEGVEGMRIGTGVERA
ncbi:beta-lactamase/transpeptidase-like protein [Lentithecium fluviatile CBS 122367]|uniref:Beta-lactamase/transpeptidase-like protein n=1 Tax=Lentithecium fluviatile CBS 122367 TaxID=1168545 RepID=A0A6G1JAK8_9PLEO|nr:beta-lactamase/transpeptidase-like protein [Lentithecium fluviatile CBS 122367]